MYPESTQMNRLLYICVVLYNNKIENIRSFAEFCRLTEEQRAVLVVCDNSTREDMIKQNTCYAQSCPNLIYLGNQGNIGLPKNYNQVFRSVAADDSWVMLSDDDTFFSRDYLDAVIRHIENPAKEKASLAAGIIHNPDGTLFSPKRGAAGLADEFIEKPGLYRDIYAVNSGLVISKNVYLQTDGFDEGLFLDMVDHDYMKELIHHGINEIQVLDGEILQDFSGKARAGFSVLYSRFRIFRKDYLYYSRKHHLFFGKTLFTLMKRFGRIMMLALMNRNDKG